MSSPTSPGLQSRKGCPSEKGRCKWSLWEPPVRTQLPGWKTAISWANKVILCHSSKWKFVSVILQLSALCPSKIIFHAYCASCSGFWSNPHCLPKREFSCCVQQEMWMLFMKMSIQRAHSMVLHGRNGRWVALCVCVRVSCCLQHLSLASGPLTE